MTSVILAFSNFQIVGCIDTRFYRGAEYPWPYGWKELTDNNVHFDQVDVELPENMATEYIRHFRALPAGEPAPLPR